MPEKIDDIKVLVQDQIRQIVDPLVNSALKKIVVEPTLHLREWDYSPNHEKLECWTIAVDETTDSSIVYSKFGFGPKNPWGLVSNSNSFFGMDSGWFDNLKECFLNSFMAGDLPIWVVEKKTILNNREVIGKNLTTAQAFEMINSLTKNNDEYHISVRRCDFA